MNSLIKVITLFILVGCINPYTALSPQNNMSDLDYVTHSFEQRLLGSTQTDTGLDYANLLQLQSSYTFSQMQSVSDDLVRYSPFVYVQQWHRSPRMTAWVEARIEYNDMWYHLTFDNENKRLLIHEMKP
jgi:hypothetical protein